MDILLNPGSVIGAEAAAARRFDLALNPERFHEAWGAAPDLCVCAPPSSGPAAFSGDIIETIEKIKPARLMLFSRADLFPAGLEEAYEDAPVDGAALAPPQAEMRRIEAWTEKNIEQHIIVRLPEVFGQNVKSGFVSALVENDPAVIARTDSRETFQLYCLNHLWAQSERAMKMNIRLIHMANEPVSAAEIVQAVNHTVFLNEIRTELPSKPVLKSRYSSLYGGDHISYGYIFGKHRVLADIYGVLENARAIYRYTRPRNSAG